MNRRSFLGALGGAAAIAAPAKRPNIVLIMADDMGFSDIGCYGGEIRTPNLDRLANRGVRFTQFYNNARCCPTRSSLMTGLYPHQGAIGHMMGDYNLPAYRGDLSRSAVTVAEALKPAGYRTLMAGKWHVTPIKENHTSNWPCQRGFEHYYGTIMGAGSFWDPASLTRDNTPIQPEGKDYYYTDAIADASSTFIRDYAGKSEPFFLYTAFTSPHWPLHAFEEDIARYKGRYKAGWDALRLERHKRQLDMGLLNRKWPLTKRDETVPAWDSVPDKEWEQRRMEVYAAQIDRMDQGIGKMLAALKASGAEDNTLILFLADNGGCAEELRPGAKAQHIPVKTRDGKPVRPGNDPSIIPGGPDTYASYGKSWANASNTPFRLYKHWVHEGGISTPLIAHWPSGIRKPGSITHQYGHIIDVMATCVDVAGAKYPTTHSGNAITPIEGKSLTPILQNKKRTEPAVFWEHEGNRAVRRGKWKLVSRYPGNWELYDIDADRSEVNDLASSNPSMAQRLKQEWEAWAKRVGVEPWDELKKRQVNA